jgi:hypothetical protein
MTGRWAVPLLALLGAVQLGADPEPGRGVARLSLLNGDVNVQRGASGDWIAAAVNAPLVTGDRLAAGRASRAEVQLDASNFVRFGENTELRLADLEGQRYQIQVENGIVTYRILRQATADVEINTPVVAVRPLRPGIYRVEVRGGETEITVRDGEAEVFSNQGSERVREGRTLLVREGFGGAVEVQQIRAAGRDDWDRWNENRDDYLRRSASYRYVSSGVYGVEDLDHHGYWRTVDGYGSCWFPQVAAGWAPYSYGRWVWMDWYGWTWVGYEPWGWAPFHYGRWFRHATFGWGWYPGPVYARSYWAPALVGFFGWGGRSGFSVGVGFGYGNIGWVPLAPGEPFYPWYGRRFYGSNIRQVNITNVTNIYNVTNIRNAYRNARFDGGVISADAGNFGRGGGRFQRVNADQVRNAGQIRGLLPVVPEQESLRVSDRVTRVSVPADRGTRFFERQAPRPVERVPFDQQRQQMARIFRGGNEDRAAGGERSEGPRSIRSLAERGGGAGASPADAPRGWQRFGETGAAGAQTGSAQRSVNRTPGVRTFAAETDNAARGQGNVSRSGGWRRFGESEPAAPASNVSPAAPDRVNRAPGPRTFGAEGPTNGERNVNRSGGWRRFGEAGPGAPASNSQAVPERGGRFGNGNPEISAPGPVRAPNTERPQRSIRDVGTRGSGFERRPASPPGNPPGQVRSPERAPGMDRGSGGNRQLQINRPIIRERAPRGSGGVSAAPRESRGPSSGGSRQVERGPARGRR